MILRSLIAAAAVTLALAAQGSAPHAELSRVQSVYILPMASGYHQHLTDQLTKLGLFQVVTDPTRADSILTDRLGESFESRLAELDAEARRRTGEPKPKTESTEGGKPGSIELAPRQMTSAIARGKGTLFLVDRGSRQVLWSTYRKPKSSQPDDLQRNSHRVADDIKRDWSGGASSKKK